MRGRRVGPAAAYEEQPHVRDDEGKNDPPHESTHTVHLLDQPRLVR